MLDSLKQITDGRGSSMFLFTDELTLAAAPVLQAGAQPVSQPPAPGAGPFPMMKEAYA